MRFISNIKSTSLCACITQTRLWRTLYTSLCIITPQCNMWLKKNFKGKPWNKFQITKLTAITSWLVVLNFHSHLPLFGLVREKLLVTFNVSSNNISFVSMAPFQGIEAGSFKLFFSSFLFFVLVAKWLNAEYRQYLDYIEYVQKNTWVRAHVMEYYLCHGQSYCAAVNKGETKSEKFVTWALSWKRLKQRLWCLSHRAMHFVSLFRFLPLPKTISAKGLTFCFYRVVSRHFE